jgi:transcriptional regulator with XRE-family HTH domain
MVTNDNLRFHFSDFVFLERTKKGLTQSHLVVASGLTRATFSAIESKSQNVTIENMGKILSSMGLSLQDFTNYLCDLEESKQARKEAIANKKER